MKRILIACVLLQPSGGRACLTAWLLQALRDRYRLTLFCFDTPDIESVNAYFGTSLKPEDFEVRQVSGGSRRVVDFSPTPSAYFRLKLLHRQTRTLLEEEDWDVVFSVEDEMDFGQPGIQYVHFPSGFYPRPDCDLRWYHRAFPWALSSYRRLGEWLAPSSIEGIQRNLTLVNSDWTGRWFRQLYDADSVTLYPPVPTQTEEGLAIPWPEREDGFVCIGRISPEKKLETVIEILSKINPPVQLHLVGDFGESSYSRKIQSLATRHHSWVSIHRDLTRIELWQLMAHHRYGIHGMSGEHFGIAVAELQSTGAIVFVPDRGGPVEIVDGDPRLTYRNIQDAVEKIENVLADAELQATILRELSERKDRFSADRFMTEIRDIVNRFITEGRPT